MKIFACSDNRFNQYMLAKGPSMYNIYRLTETMICNDAMFYIAGISVSIVFCKTVPPFMPNKVIK